MNNVYYGKLIFELSKPGRVGYSLPKNELSGEYRMSEGLPAELLRRPSRACKAPARCTTTCSVAWPRLPA